MSTSKRAQGAPAPLYLSILGCPGSGVEFLQHILGSHPAVAVVPETRLYAMYLRQLTEAYEREVGVFGPSSDIGVAAGLPRNAFTALTASFAEALLKRLVPESREARILLKQDPSEILVMDLIRELHPNARFVHVVRDPRSTAALLMAASRQTGPWMPLSALEAAESWTQWVAAGRRVEEFGDEGRTVRCEELLTEGTGVLTRFLAWLGLERSEELDRRVRCARTPGEVQPSMNEYEWFRKGWGQEWRTDLLDAEIAEVEGHAWAAMTDIGYEPTIATGPRRMRRRRLSRVRRRVAGRLGELGPLLAAAADRAHTPIGTKNRVRRKIAHLFRDTGRWIYEPDS